MDEELDMLMGDDSPGLSQADLEDALKSVSTSWLKKIELGLKHKTPFTRDAREAMNFFDGKGDWFWKKKPIQENGNVDVEPPTFRMTVNKTFEAVKLFGAVMYARNPVRTVTPRKYPAVPPSALGIDINQPPEIDPMTGVPVEDPAIANFIATSNAVMMAEEQKTSVAKLIEAYLNYTPNKLDLKEHSKKVVDEAIIKGLGVWWTEIVEIPADEGEPYRMVGSFFGSADDIVWDPDADEQEDARWVARRCVGTRAELAAQYERPIDDFKGVAESNAAKEEEGTRGYKTKQRNGQTNDQVVYWKIYSKTGFGHTLKGAKEEYRKTFDALGENCYIVVSEGVDYPLNVPKEVAAEEPDEETGMPASLHGRTRWPIPFYQENNGWPCTLLQFHRKSGYSWPISHMKPGMPELKFMNWVMSFLATRAITSCKTLIGIAKAAESDLEQVILKGDKNGFTFFRISETLGRSVEDLISVLQLPPVSREIWDVLKEVSEQFDKRVGLTELVFGMTRNQFRSAAEAQVKAEQISVRPDDMANTLEDAMSMLSRREALALQWLLEPADVAPVLGPLGAQAWQKLVTPLTVSQIAMEFDYRIEAGSARKPNKASRVEQMQMAVQNIGPVLQGLIMQGNPGPWNALMAAWCDSIDLDPAPFMIPPPPPPPPALPPMGPADAPPGAPPGEPGGGAPPSEPPPMPMPDQIPPELDPGL